ncbi:MAG: arylsulfatase A-like enzyme, partial [Yoonia sp.]
MKSRILHLCLLTLFTAALQTSARTPNILFIFLDDFGWKDTSYMGSDFYESPNLDRLASEGMIFSDAYACAANCAPSRACLLSGQYTPRHEIFNVGTQARGKAAHRRLEHIGGTDTLDPEIRTWAHQLKDT